MNSQIEKLIANKQMNKHMNKQMNTQMHRYRNKTTVRHHIRKDHNQEDPDAFITRSAYNHSDLECQYCGTTFGC